MTVIDAPRPTAAPAPLQRARGRARVTFKTAGPGAPTMLDDLWQEGSCKVRLPRVHDGRGPVAVLINTAGGVTGGDHLVYEAAFGPDTTATVTSQAAERIYRRSADTGRIDNRLTLADRAEARWLPQETIVFDRAALARRTEVDMAASARLTAVEAVVLGRRAMGEEVGTLEFHDHWRVRRGGRLVFADAARLVGDSRAILAGGATGRGARAFATLLRVAPDAESLVDGLRDTAAALAAGRAVEAGFSAFDGILVGRLIAEDGAALRALLEPLLTDLVGGALPRVWAI